ncbi:MAG: AAA family ATPase [Planctomycetes bacterium]|nr:AAA family ATPase [Planctomycetota bacterium]MCC7171972.1 AAA family ATPase [Planctomycetota bacterium]
MTETRERSERVEREARVFDDVVAEVGKVLVGQRALVERLLLGLLCDGHVLLEGVPGIAKTLAVEALARTLAVQFKRIQFTPDLLPSDVLGTPVYQPAKGTFEVRRGPIFTNLLLADEVNRAPAKVHAALLEAMAERKVSLDGVDHALPQPFLVLATQNPIEQEGTYPLPEAALDRFFLKVKVDYPTFDEEREIVARQATTAKKPELRVIASAERLLEARALVDAIYVDDRLVRYALAIVRATREPKAAGFDDLADAMRFGASPRASIALVLAARGHALLRGRAFASPADIKAIAHDVLRHRIQPSYAAEAQGIDADAIVTKLLDRTEIP